MRIAGNILWLLMAATPAVATLAATLDPVVVERQADMKTMSAAAKSLAETFAGKKPYDMAAFRTDARTIAGMGGGRLTAHFASVTAADGSQARSEIASDRVKFEKLARDLQVYAEQVAAAAAVGGTMPASMRMRPEEVTEGGPFAKKRAGQPDVSSYSSEHAFHMMLQTCSLCHAAFRQPR
jgi:cytochrome c556